MEFKSKSTSARLGGNESEEQLGTIEFIKKF